MPYQKVNYLEDLPDVDEVDSGTSGGLTPQQTKLSKRFIRTNSTMMPESGMVLQPSGPIPFNMEENPHTPTTQNNVFKNSPIIEMPNIPPQPQPQYQQQPHFQPQMSCQDIFYHIESCPLCTKFYKHDNTVYLVIIAILVLVCALLMKKVLFD